MRKFMDELTAYLCALHIKRVKRATFYRDPKSVVQITERGKWRKRQDRLDFCIMLGRPNYVARKVIKKLVKAGEPFPVKKVQMKLRKGMN